MSQRVIAIGDIHGCATALRKLIEVICPEPDDTLIPLGDCVDRGPDSRQVIDELLQLREKCRVIPFLGNHEEMMLNFLDGKPQPDDWLQCGGAETVESYRGADGKLAPMPDEHVNYIRTWGDCFETKSHFFAHGAYHSEQPLSEQRWNVWRWHSLRDMVPGPHVSGKTAVVGHTSQKSGEILNVGHLLCIDTYCWGGGWLTAIDTTTGQIWQISRDGVVRVKGSPSAAL
ncbi:MAG: serine/threonine protein phosphatase [Planctomycetes bacterium]|nr:serine/threonine protein phosphatase [Planctomycetota bacterium]